MNTLTEDQLVVLSNELKDETYKGDTLVDVSLCARSMEAFQEEIVALETKLSHFNSILKMVDTSIIPQLLSRAKLNAFELDNGDKISVKEQVYASLPKEDKAARDVCLNWLNEVGAGALIKDQLVVTSPTKELIEECRGKFAIDVNRDIHHATLKSFLSEALGVKANSVARLNPDEVPPELHLYIESRTTIKKVK